MAYVVQILGIPMSSFASAHQDFSETLVNNVSHIGSRLGSGFVEKAFLLLLMAILKYTNYLFMGDP